MSQLLRPREVAERLGVSKPTVRALLDRGVFQTVVIPGGSTSRRMRRVLAESVDRWIEENVTNAGERSSLP